MGKKKIVSSAITEQISLPSIPGELKYKINLKCKNAKQKELVKKIKENQITIVEGVFGVGKTFVINSIALDMLKKQENDIDKIILICPTVETGDMHLGLLPGDLSQKVENHILNELDSMRKILLKSENQNPNQIIDELIKKGFSDAKAIIGDGKMRVCINSYTNETEAYRALNKLRQNKNYKNAWILKKKQEQ